MRLILAALAALALSTPVASAGALHLRLSSFPTYSRIMVDEARGSALFVKHRADQVVIGSAGSSLATIAGHARLVLHSSAKAGEVTLDLAPQASLRQFKRGSMRIIDIFASVSVRSAQAQSAHGSPSGPPSVQGLVPGLPPAFSARIENARQASARQDPPYPSAGRQYDTKVAPAPPGPQLETVAQPSNAGTAQSSATQAIAAAPISSPGMPDAILLPFSADVGVAAIRHPHLAEIFFDEARPLDLSAFQGDRTFGRATVSMQTSFTELKLPIAPEQSIALSRQPEGWRLTVGNIASRPTTITFRPEGNELHLQLPAPGKALVAVDPATGALLLIGTDREARSALPVDHRSAAFEVDHSEIGLVVEPFSDRLSLRPIRGGFSLFRDDGRGLNVSSQTVAVAPVAALSALTRSLDFPLQATQDLVEQLHAQMLVAAQAAPRARLSPRLAVAQTMIALGMGREARTLLRVAFADDPTAVSDPRARLLRALADTLTDPDQANSLSDPALPLDDETRLWRALDDRDRSLPGETDASIIRSALPLILSYPARLRDITARLAAPVLLAGASNADLAALQRLPSAPGTMVAKAVAIGMQGNPKGALSRLDTLARNHDLKVSSDAILALTLLRAKLGWLSPSVAADALASHRLDWRATGREGEALMNEADLRRQAGQLTQAFGLWRETERRFPDLAKQAQANIVANLRRLAGPGVAASMSPADFILVISDCARELASQEQVAAELAPILAERLEALDLPVQATEILEQVMNATATGVSKARLGFKLASLRLDQDDLTGARGALDQSDAIGLPAAVAEERHLVLARLLERQGDHDAALAAIGRDDGAGAQDARATILANAGRWHDAKLVLEGLSSQFPAHGGLDRSQADQAIRLATAASHDGDTALLLRLAHAVDGRFPDPDQQQTFSLMTAPLIEESSPPRSPNTG